MDINSIQGANAYQNTQSTPPPVDDTQLREQNVEASRSELDTRREASRAFEVSLTQEARDLLAAEENDRATEPAESTTSEAAANEPVVPTQDASQIVNIVA